MAKAPPFAIIFTVLGAFLLFQRRYIWLFPLMFFFVWSYSLFPMLFVAAVIWTLIIAWNENRFEWRPVAYTAAGMVAGNIVNPYFPRNLYLFMEHAATKLRTQYDVPVGGEWYPYESNILLGSCAIAFLAMLIGFVLYRADERKLEEKSTFFLVFTTIFMVWIFQSKRIAEYFPPLAILFAAFAFNAFRLRKLAGENALPEDFQRDIAPYLDKNVQGVQEEKQEVWKTAFVSLVCVILLVWMFFTFRGLEIESRRIDYKGLVADITGNDPPEKYQRAMEWAIENIPAGERIFNTDWDDFPKLFFHNQKHSYVAGLDPNYLYSRNPELWKEFEAITTGKTGDFAGTIREKFGARYVFSDNNHDDFFGKAMDSGWFEKVYEDDESFILKIRDQKGENSAETNDAANDEPAANDAGESEETPESAPNK